MKFWFMRDSSYHFLYINMKNVGKGLLADSIGIMCAGAISGMACDTSASNVGNILALPGKILDFNA